VYHTPNKRLHSPASVKQRSHIPAFSTTIQWQPYQNGHRRLNEVNQLQRQHRNHWRHPEKGDTITYKYKKIIIQNKRNKLFDCTRHACKYTIRIAFESYKIFKFIIKVQNILSCNNTQCQPVEGPQQHQQPHHSAGHQSRLAANNHQLGFTQQQRQRPHQYLHRQPRQQGGQCPVSSVRIMLWEI